MAISVSKISQFEWRCCGGNFKKFNPTFSTLIDVQLHEEGGSRRVFAHCHAQHALLPTDLDSISFVQINIRRTIEAVRYTCRHETF